VASEAGRFERGGALERMSHCIRNVDRRGGGRSKSLRSKKEGPALLWITGLTVGGGVAACRKQMAIRRHPGDGAEGCSTRSVSRCYLRLPDVCRREKKIRVGHRPRR